MREPKLFYIPELKRSMSVRALTMLPECQTKSAPATWDRIKKMKKGGSIYEAITKVYRAKEYFIEELGKSLTISELAALPEVSVAGSVIRDRILLKKPSETIYEIIQRPFKARGTYDRTEVNMGVKFYNRSSWIKTARECDSLEEMATWEKA